MSINHIVRINADGGPVGLYRLDATVQSCDYQALEAWSDPLLKRAALIILVPAQWVYQTTTQVASKNEEILKKSIPFAVEEELSNDPEDNFFAYRLQEDGSQQVVAIQKAALSELHQQIKTHGLQVSQLYSEDAWLPAKDQVMHVWVEGDWSLLRFGTDQAMPVATSQLEQLVPVYGAGCQRVISNQALNIADKTVDVTLDESQCCAQVINGQHIDLYVEALKHQKSAQQQSSWRAVWALAALLFISWLGIHVYQLMQLNQQVDALKQQQQNLLVQAFPDAAAVELNDPYAAVQSRMQRISGQSERQSSVLLDAVHGIGQVISRVGQVQVKGMRLSNQVMEIQINAPSMSVINQFHQALQNTVPQYRVLIGVNELGDDNVFKSILTMEAR
jgi:general secretion pathway protein L